MAPLPLSPLTVDKEGETRAVSSHRETAQTLSSAPPTLRGASLDHVGWGDSTTKLPG